MWENIKTWSNALLLPFHCLLLKQHSFPLITFVNDPCCSISWCANLSTQHLWSKSFPDPSNLITLYKLNNYYCHLPKSGFPSNSSSPFTQLLKWQLGNNLGLPPLLQPTPSIPSIPINFVRYPSSKSKCIYSIPSGQNYPSSGHDHQSSKFI